MVKEKRIGTCYWCKAPNQKLTETQGYTHNNDPTAPVYFLCDSCMGAHVQFMLDDLQQRIDQRMRDLGYDPNDPDTWPPDPDPY